MVREWAVEKSGSDGQGGVVERGGGGSSGAGWRKGRGEGGVEKDRSEVGDLITSFLIYAKIISATRNYKHWRNYKSHLAAVSQISTNCLRNWCNNLDCHYAGVNNYEHTNILTMTCNYGRIIRTECDLCMRL